MSDGGGPLGQRRGEGEGRGEGKAETPLSEHKLYLDRAFSSPRSKNLLLTMMSLGEQKESVRCLDSFGVLE